MVLFISSSTKLDFRPETHGFSSRSYTCMRVLSVLLVETFIFWRICMNELALVVNQKHVKISEKMKINVDKLTSEICHWSSNIMYMWAFSWIYKVWLGKKTENSDAYQMPVFLKTELRWMGKRVVDCFQWNSSRGTGTVPEEAERRKKEKGGDWMGRKK